MFQHDLVDILIYQDSWETILVRLNKKNFCLKAPARIHFSLHIRLSWNGRFIIFLFNFLKLFCQKLTIFLQIWKIKIQIITTRSIWQQPNLVPTPLPVLSSFPCYIYILYRMTVISTSCGGGGKHSASIFETLESFETRQNIIFLASYSICLYSGPSYEIVQIEMLEDDELTVSVLLRESNPRFPCKSTVNIILNDFVSTHVKAVQKQLEI